MNTPCAETWNGARFQILAGKRIDNRQTLRLVGEKTGKTIAHYAAQAGQLITDPELLVLVDYAGRSVAQVMAEFAAGHGLQQVAA